MATITKVEEKVKQNGKKSWKFTLGDGVQGYITNDKPWEYKEGENVTYTKEEKKTPNGSYNLLTLTRVVSTSTSSPTSVSSPNPESEKKSDVLVLPKLEGVMRAKSIQEMKYEGRVYCLKLAVKCLLAKAVEYPKVKDYFTEWVELLDASIDEIKE